MRAPHCDFESARHVGGIAHHDVAGLDARLDPANERVQVVQLPAEARRYAGGADGSLLDHLRRIAGVEVEVVA